jgi:hypothetical protein
MELCTAQNVVAPSEPFDSAAPRDQSTLPNFPDFNRVSKLEHHFDVEIGK